MELVLNTNLHVEFTHLRTMKEEREGRDSFSSGKKKKLREPNVGLSPNLLSQYKDLFVQASCAWVWLI